ncbi:MAG: glycosyltransferase [Parachlamydia sp.]|nr:glycosyltransferase [Parachlamydia sp.]
MRMLIVTEKCSPELSQRDGGSRLVETLRRSLGNSLDIMQFGMEIGTSATWRFDYPFHSPNRFERRLANARFIAEQVKHVENDYTHVLFIHLSMQFGLVELPLREGIEIWTFPMFLTPSYLASEESVPESYTEREKQTLASSTNILTPSYLEKMQLQEYYLIPSERIHVIPRGIESTLLIPQKRSCNGPPRFCSIGSIKPQKNTLGLIALFAKIRNRHPQASLQIIGPIQDAAYHAKVCHAIDHCRLKDAVQFTGYLAPEQLAKSILDAHIHLSTSMCETFGRAIFETLANGLPNIARKTGNAAAQFLEQLPYARFHDDPSAALASVEEILVDLPALSSMACEIGALYDDELLARLLLAKIRRREWMAVSDFDGTLYHKNNPAKTQECMEAFMRYPVRSVCSARSVPDLFQQLDAFNLKADWLIGYSGAVVADGSGKVLWQTPLSTEDLARLKRHFPQGTLILSEGHVMQVSVPSCGESWPFLPGIRRETYQGIAYLSDWQASKLRAVHQLLCHLKWQGQVKVFGDGPYDHELVHYFDGTLIPQTTEKIHV